jgi:lauroyl/myristoyl acyltransferase
MSMLIHGRFRTAVDRLPAARSLHQAARIRRYFAPPVARYLIALFVTFRTIGPASTNIQAVVGGSRRRVTVLTILPLLRYWHSFLPLLFSDSKRAIHPGWIDRVDTSELERLLAIRASGAPVLVAMPHLSFTPLVLCYALARRGVPVAINTAAPNIYGRIPGVEAFDPDDSFRSFLALRDGKVLLYAADVAGPGVACRLFGRFVSFPLIFADIAERTDAAIFLASCSGFRSGRIKIELGEPFFTDGRPADVVTQDIVHRLEPVIRRQSFEWFPAGPFLSNLSFCETGVIPTLVAVLGPDPTNLGERYRRKFESCRGFNVDQVSIEDIDLAALVARLRAEQHELLVLARPQLGSEIEEVTALINWFFRLPTDWVAFDPETSSIKDDLVSLTSFSLSVVKTCVLESLLAQGAKRLDATAFRLARRFSRSCLRVPSTSDLLREIQGLHGRGAPITALVRDTMVAKDGV